MGKRKKLPLNKKLVSNHTTSVTRVASEVGDEQKISRFPFGLIVERVKRTRSWRMVALTLGLLWSFQEFAYPKLLDYWDGKLGGEIVLGVGDAILNNGTPTYFFYATPKNAKYTRYLVPISLSVRNTSKVRDSDVTLSVRYEKKYNRRSIPEEFVTHSGTRSLKELSHELNGNDRYDYVNHTLKFLPSEDSFSFTEAAFSSPTGWDRQIPPLLASGEGVDILATTFSEKDVRRKWDIRYRGVRVDSYEGIQRYIKDWYTKNIALEIREKSTFWGYLRALLFSGDMVVYGFLPDFTLIQNLNLYLPKAQPENYVGFKFNPYAWSLLFDRKSKHAND